MNKKLPILVILFFFLAISTLSFWQFFLKDLYPFPGNFMLVQFEPWKTDYTSADGTPLLFNKPVADDIFRQIYPLRTLAMDLLKSGQLPLWNPYNGSGMPLLATLNIGFLDPFNLLYFIFPNYLAWTISIVIQPSLIGIFTYLLARKLKLSALSSLFTAVFFVFSGVVTVRLVYGMFGLAFAMLPLLLYCVECLVQNPKSKQIWLFPFAAAITIVSTQPQISLYILVFAFCYALYRFWQYQIDYKYMLFFLSLFILGIGLAGIQLIPTAELHQQANITRASSAIIFKNFLIPFSHLITLAIPNYYGSPSTYNFFGSADYIEAMGYLGTIPLLFFVLSIFSYSKFKKTPYWFFLVASIICIISAIKLPFSGVFFSLPIPIISTGIPSRIFILSTFGLAICAGYGLDILFSKPEKRLSYFFKASPFFIFILGISAWTIFSQINHFPCPSTSQNCHIVSLRNLLIEVIPLSVLFVFLLIILNQKNKLVKQLFLLCALLFVFGLGLYNSQKYQPFSVKESFYPKNSLISALQRYTKDARVFGYNEANISTDFASWFRFYDPQYYHPLYIKRYGQLVSFSNTGQYPPLPPRSDVNIINTTGTISADQQIRRDRLLDILGVKYEIFKKPYAASQPTVWQDRNWVIKENVSSLPRVYLVDMLLVEKDDKKILSTLFSKKFSPQNQAIVEKFPPSIAQTSSGKLQGKAKIVDIFANTVKISVSASQTAFLVLLDNYYEGWNAYVDGAKTPIYRTNYTFRGIVVPQGSHTISFMYQPLSFYYGILMTVASGGVLAVLFFVKEVVMRRVSKSTLFRLPLR